MQRYFTSMMMIVNCIFSAYDEMNGIPCVNTKMENALESTVNNNVFYRNWG